MLLSDVEGFSYPEIADFLAVPSGTVARLARGREQLQRRLWRFFQG